MARPTRVAVALGGGGARGYAHIGVLEVLAERGYEIAGLAGTSMGAVVGGLHAAGQLSPYADWVRGLTQRDVLRLMDPSLRAPGAIRGDKILAKVTELLGGMTIEELAVPFTAVATDLEAGKEVWLQRGPVDVAVRASMALPSFLPPVVVNGRLLADGGLLNPVPVVATAAVEADVTMAVSLSEEHHIASGPAPVRESSAGSENEPLERSRRTAAQMLDGELVRTISSWFSGGREPGEDLPEEEPGEVLDELYGTLPPGLRTLDVMQLSLDAMRQVVTRYRLAGYPPDLLITVPKAACRTLDFHRAEEMIALGRERATEVLDREGPPARR